MRSLRGIVIALGLGLALGACGKPAASPCAAWIEKSMSCDSDVPGMTAAERADGKRLLERVCVDATERDPALLRAELACAARPTCAEFEACEAALD